MDAQVIPQRIYSWAILVWSINMQSVMNMQFLASTSQSFHFMETKYAAHVHSEREDTDVNCLTFSITLWKFPKSKYTWILMAILAEYFEGL